ncbi:MAG TPA: NAD-dependent epimerase/dehydratase family protein [Lacunisphaera sp.]|nr:NAD-dependent epimerase/dehydratase family protein [Lacunisphaera sp.]
MSATSPKCLHVTGGRGRLASLIADHYRAPAHEVLLYSRGGGPGFRPLTTLLQPGAVGPADVVLHLAWSTLPATSEQNPGSEHLQDLPLLRKMLEACISGPAAQRPHFVFFSSGGAIYGNAPGRPNVESDPCQPIGSYGRAKLAAETLIQATTARETLPCTILRISNPYGYPVPSGRAQGVIPHAIRCAIGNQALTLWGDGHARKDFIYYTDFLWALDEIIARRLTGVFNLCSGESHSVHEIISLVEKHTEKKVLTTHTPGPAWDVRDSRLDHGRLTEATGWEPQVGLDEGIRRSAAPYLNH